MTPGAARESGLSLLKTSILDTGTAREVEDEGFGQDMTTVEDM